MTYKLTIEAVDDAFPRWMFREALNKSSLTCQSTPRKKRCFFLSYKINRLARSILATLPCVAGISELIRGSLDQFSPLFLICCVKLHRANAQVYGYCQA